MVLTMQPALKPVAAITTVRVQVQPKPLPVPTFEEFAPGRYKRAA
jgi:hypothetical protein